jgi:hypothetical protein
VRQNWEREVSMRFGEKSQWMEVCMALMRERERARTTSARAASAQWRCVGSEARERDDARAHVRTSMPLLAFCMSFRASSCMPALQAQCTGP